MEDKTEYLEHYGILGMKWGVRRKRRAARKEAKRAKVVAEEFSARAYAQKKVAKYGSKERAIQKVAKKADRQASIRKALKKGAGTATTLLGASGAVTVGMQSSLVSAGVLAASAPAFASGMLLPYAALTAGGIALANSKKRISRKKKQEIHSIEKYG